MWGEKSLDSKKNNNSKSKKSALKKPCKIPAKTQVD